MRKKAKKTKESSETSINIPGNISWNMKPTNSQTASQQKEPICREYDCEIRKLMELVADIATGIWRIKNNFSTVNLNDLPDEVKKAYRHIESTWDALNSAQVNVLSHTGEKYPHGNPQLDVIAFEPSSSVQIEIITETIKPTIFFKDTKIQMGQVVVAKPKETKSKENNKSNNICENKERDTK